MTEEESEKAYIALRNRYYKFSSVSGPGVEGFRTLEHFVEFCLKLGYTPNHRLLRKDTTLPASPTNLIVLRAKKDPGTGKEITPPIRYQKVRSMSMKKSAMYAEAILAIADQYSAGHLSPEDFLAINAELNDQYSMYLSCELRKEAEQNA